MGKARFGWKGAARCCRDGIVRNAVPAFGLASSEKEKFVQCTR